MALRITLTILLALSASLALLLATHVLRRRNLPGALSMSFILAGQTLWAGLSLCDLYVAQLLPKLLLDGFIFTASHLSLLGVLLFTLAYTGRVRLAYKLGPFGFGYLLLSSLLFASDPLHQLLRLNPVVHANGPIPLLMYQNGPLMALQIAIDYSAAFMAILILVRSAAQSTPATQIQAWALVLSLFLPITLSLFSVVYPHAVTVVPSHVLVPIGFLLVYPILAWSLFSQRLLEVLPVAHNLLLEKLPDGIILVDVRGRLAAANHKARTHFGTYELGAPLDQLLPEVVAQPGFHDLTAFELQLVRSDETNTRIYFAVSGTPLRDRWGRVGGQVLVLRDITAQHNAEVELRERETAYRNLAFEHARLYQEARQQSAEAETLRQAVAAVASTLDVQEAVNQIVEQLALVVPHDSASVQLRRGDYSEVFGCRGFPDPQQVIGLRFPISSNLLCTAIYLHREVVVLPEIRPEHEFVNVPGILIRSWMAFPLLVGERVIGLLALDSHQAHHFTAEHVRVVRAFAAHVAIALEHSQLYWDAVQGRERLLQLQQATRMIAAHSTVTDGLYAAVHQATAQLMPADAFAIILLDQHQQAHLVYHANLGPSFAQAEIQALLDRVLQHRGMLFFSDQALGSPDLVPLRAGIAVPLRSHQTPRGILLTQSRLDAAYRPEDGTLLELLAAHVSTALKTSAIFTEVERLATTDGLTGLFNRRHFFHLAQLEADAVQHEQRPLSTILFDLDHFKQINDTYGHQSGDAVLRAVAETCKLCLRDRDLIGRYGGEEFAILLPGTCYADALLVGERIRVALAAQVVHIAGHDLQISVSLGVATDTPGQHQNLDHLLARADAALYQAKAAGRNRVVGEGLVSTDPTILA